MCLTSEPLSAADKSTSTATTPTTVLVVRHGETEWNTQGRWQGQQDSPLTDEGIQQALALGERLKRSGVKVDCVYSSDLLRAKRSAEMLCKSLDMDPGLIRLNVDMRERSFGIFEGRTRAEVSEEYPVELNKYYSSNDGEFKVEGGESRRELIVRSLKWLEEVGKEHDGGTVLVMTHGAVVSALFREMLAIPYDPKPAADLRIRNTCICELRRDPGSTRWTVLSLGDVAHTEGRGLHGELAPPVEQEVPATETVERLTHLGTASAPVRLLRRLKRSEKAKKVGGWAIAGALGFLAGKGPLGLIGL